MTSVSSFVLHQELIHTSGNGSSLTCNNIAPLANSTGNGTNVCKSTLELL